MKRKNKERKRKKQRLKERKPYKNSLEIRKLKVIHKIKRKKKNKSIFNDDKCDPKTLLVNELFQKMIELFKIMNKVFRLVLVYVLFTKFN